MRPDISLKEQIEHLMAIDASRVSEGHDFSWTFEYYQTELTHKQSHLFEWVDVGSKQSLDGFVICRTIVEGECEIMHMACNLPGKGKVLMQEWLKWAAFKNIKKVLLECHHDNAAAQNLYKKMGFKETSRRARYYRDGGDAILMTLNLNAPV